MALNWVDAVLIVLVLLGAWSGWRRGFVIAFLQLLTLAISLAVAFSAYRFPTRWLESSFPAIGLWAQPVGFLATYLVAQLLLGAGEVRIARAVPRKVHVHPANRGLGMAPGVVGGILNALVVALILLTVPQLDAVNAPARDSAIASRLAEPAAWVESRLAPIFDPALQHTLQALTVPAESPAFTTLPFHVTEPKTRPELEARMLDLVNNERAAKGLRPLQADPALAVVARAHSRDMFARGYFSHVSPEGDDPFARMRKADVRFLAAGENLALARSLAMAHQGLMNSPGHRANILRPQFGRLGVGVLDGGLHGLMVTQEFRN